jgi:hypothetical protein
VASEGWTEDRREASVADDHAEAPVPLTVSPDAPRETDRPSYLLALALLFAGGVLLLGVMAVVGTGHRHAWFWLFAIPAVLLVAALVTGLRTYRGPSARERGQNS